MLPTPEIERALTRLRERRRVAISLPHWSYLFWLGWRAVRARQRGVEAPQGPARQPFWHGILFGLTNPKAYPVAVATFTALLSSRAE